MTMKAKFNLISLLLLFFLFNCAYAITSVDTTKVKDSKTVDLKMISEQITKTNETVAKVNESLKKMTEENTKKEVVLSKPQKVLVILPILLFFMCLLITFLFAKRSKVDFKQALFCDEPEEVTKLSGSQTNPTETVKVSLLDKDGNLVYMPSVSRIIAFLSSLTTLAVIVCFVSYNAYCMLTKQNLPDFKNLFEIIAGLGLGIVPYGFNKITATTAVR